MHDVKYIYHTVVSKVVGDIDFQVDMKVYMLPMNPYGIIDIQLNDLRENLEKKNNKKTWNKKRRTSKNVKKTS